MSESLHPTEGIRVRFCRDSETPAAARYVAEVFTPGERFEYRADLRGDGSVDLQPIGPTAAADDEKQLRNFAASIARAAPRNQEQGLPPWPARVVRWRGPR